MEVEVEDVKKFYFYFNFNFIGLYDGTVPESGFGRVKLGGE